MNVKSDLAEGGNTPDAEEGQGQNTEFTITGTVVNSITVFLRQIETFLGVFYPLKYVLKPLIGVRNQTGSL